MFHHGWPLSSDDWDAQTLFFLVNGYRVVAHDRRGHGEPQGRVAKAVLIAAVPPLMVKTEKNPGGTPIEVLDGFRKPLLRIGRNFFSMFLRVRFTASTDPEQRYQKELSRIGGLRG